MSRRATLADGIIREVGKTGGLRILESLTLADGFRTVVGVYHSDEGGMDPEGGKWSVVCEEHGEILGTDEYRRALVLRYHPAEWCEQCNLHVGTGHQYLDPITLTVKVVPDEACPECGAFWGHPDPALDYPNRTKVMDGDGWWWRCYNPDCRVGYYNPETGGVEHRSSRELEQERADELRVRVQREIAEHGLRVETHRADGTVTDDSIPPDPAFRLDDVVRRAGLEIEPEVEG